MRVNLRCFSKLANQETCNFNENTSYHLNKGHTVENLVERAGIAREDVKIAFVNSRIADFDTALADGDRVGLAPATGGM